MISSFLESKSWNFLPPTVSPTAHSLRPPLPLFCPSHSVDEKCSHLRRLHSLLCLPVMFFLPYLHMAHFFLTSFRYLFKCFFLIEIFPLTRLQGVGFFYFTIVSLELNKGPVP